MAKFGIGDLIDIKNSKSQTEGVNAFQEIWLNPHEVKPSESNFYSQEKIEELADSFLAVGQQQPTVLARINGEFQIVSGHRRNLANIMNLERGHEEYKQVKYLYKDMTPSMLELSLLMGNAYNRELTAWEKTQQAKRLKEALLKAKKEDGLEITGKLRDVIAGLMNESSSNIAKMECINNKAVPELQEEFQKGNIGISVAYEATKLPSKEQKAVAKKTAEGTSVPLKAVIGKNTGKEAVREKNDTKSKDQESDSAEVFESNTSQQTEEEKPMNKVSRTEKKFLHKKRLREWEQDSFKIVAATKKVSDVISKVFESNTLPQQQWKDMEWTVFFTKGIMRRADHISEDDLYLLHDIMLRCQKAQKSVKKEGAKK